MDRLSLIQYVLVHVHSTYVLFNSSAAGKVVLSHGNPFSSLKIAALFPKAHDHKSQNTTIHTVVRRNF